jgi:hypothetical protein
MSTGAVASWRAARADARGDKMGEDATRARWLAIDGLAGNLPP